MNSRVYAADGERDDRVDMAWMERKFRRITAPFLTPEGQDQVLDLLRGDLERPMSQVVERVNRALGL